jgi:hypothetical protein
LQHINLSAACDKTLFQSMIDDAADSATKLSALSSITFVTLDEDFAIYLPDLQDYMPNLVKILLANDSDHGYRKFEAALLRFTTDNIADIGLLNHSHITFYRVYRIWISAPWFPALQRFTVFYSPGHCPSIPADVRKACEAADVELYKSPYSEERVRSSFYRLGLLHANEEIPNSFLGSRSGRLKVKQVHLPGDLMLTKFFLTVNPSRLTFPLLAPEGSGLPSLLFLILKFMEAMSK